MDIMSILSLLGGLGLFLYGMKVMGEGLEQAAGKKLQSIIERYTNKPIKGVLAGTIVTALVQSSSAVTVMVIGFVNAGIMDLFQATGVIMGANVGTTVTAWIISLGDLTSNAWYLMLLKPSNLAPMVTVVGVAMLLFGKKKRVLTVGQILSGFGILFIGMNMMESSMSGLSDSDAFKQAFVTFANNPLLGILVGCGITAIIQSSSASVGILQAAAKTGAITFGGAVPIILGQNIGTCVTALLSSIGANKTAKRAAIIHLAFNVVGTAIFITIFYVIVKPIFHPDFFNGAVNRTSIAIFHTLFNVFNTIIFLPFVNVLVAISNYIIRGGEPKVVKSTLDDRFLSTPAIAVNQAIKEVSMMAETAKTNLLLSRDVIEKYDPEKIEEIKRNEDIIDKMESNITQYIVKISEKQLTPSENETVSGLFHVIVDVERIGDHCLNISDIATTMHDDQVTFTQSAIKELNQMFNLVDEIIETTIKCYQEQDPVLASKIQPMEQVVDVLKDTMRLKHLERLSDKECDFKSGVMFLEITTNLERISDHCSNIGIAVEQLEDPEVYMDSHEFTKHIKDNQTSEYRKVFEEYHKKYQIES